MSAFHETQIGSSALEHRPGPLDLVFYKNFPFCLGPHRRRTVQYPLVSQGLAKFASNLCLGESSRQSLEVLHPLIHREIHLVLSHGHHALR